MTMKLYAQREGNAQCGEVSFDAQRGIKITIHMEDCETVVKVQGIDEPIENVHNVGVAERCAQKIASRRAGFLHFGYA